MPHTHTHTEANIEATHTHTCRSHIDSLLLYRPFPFPHAASRLLFVPSQIVRTRRAFFVSPHRRSSCRSYSCSCSALSSGGGTVFCVHQNCVNFSCHVVDLHVSHGAVLLVVVIVGCRSHRCHRHNRRRPCIPCFSLLLLSSSSLSSSFQFVVYSSSINCSDFSNIIHKRFVPILCFNYLFLLGVCFFLSSTLLSMHIMLFTVPPFVPVSSAILIAAPFYVSPFIGVFWNTNL